MTASKLETQVKLSGDEIVVDEEEDFKDLAPCSISELYQFAEPVDYALMFFGTLGAIGAGFCQPVFCLLFGTAMDNLNSGDIQTQINKLCVWL